MKPARQGSAELVGKPTNAFAMCCDCVLFFCVCVSVVAPGPCTSQHGRWASCSTTVAVSRRIRQTRSTCTSKKVAVILLWVALSGQHRRGGRVHGYAHVQLDGNRLARVLFFFYSIWSLFIVSVLFCIYCHILINIVILIVTFYAWDPTFYEAVQSKVGVVSASSLA